jgi:hypothetical protein
VANVPKKAPAASWGERPARFISVQIELNLLKNPPEHSAATVREHIRPALLIMLYISRNGHRLHRPRENPDRGMVDAAPSGHPALLAQSGKLFHNGTKWPATMPNMNGDLGTFWTGMGCCQKGSFRGTCNGRGTLPSAVNFARGRGGVWEVAKVGKVAKNAKAAKGNVEGTFLIN